MNMFDVILFIILFFSSAFGGTLSPYINSSYFELINFGQYSHWLIPWRAYLTTLPASAFVDGIGIVWNPDPQYDATLIAEMMVNHGIKNIRMELDWGGGDYTNSSNYPFGNPTTKVLQACKQYGIRPMILLNANSGGPCPRITFTVNAAAAAAKGASKIQLSDVSNVMLNYTGINIAGDNMAAGIFIVELDGNTAHLSSPLPIAFSLNDVVTLCTLKFRPFSPNYTSDYTDTLNGFVNYAAVIVETMTNFLGTQGADDKGFDLEIWNELTFGSEFLNINNYYDPPLYPNWTASDIWTELPNAISKFVDENPSKFSGIHIGDGFSNTEPWPASTELAHNIHSINKHPYHGRTWYPANASHDNPLNALGYKDNKTYWIPTYTELFPEYFAAALQTETMVRDMGPFINDVYKVVHGAYARVDPTTNETIPCPVWITEVNIAPGSDQRNITDERALYIKAKTTSRYYSFFINKGVERLYIYDFSDGDLKLGELSDYFLNYTMNMSNPYPSNDAPYTSPALATVSNIVTQLKMGIDKNVAIEPLILNEISDTHDNLQWLGNGTDDPLHPNMYDRNVFAFLPYQVNATKYIVMYYVCTFDVMVDLPPEKFTLNISSTSNFTNAEISAYDPILNQAVKVNVVSSLGNELIITVMAADYPYLLSINLNPPSGIPHTSTSTSTSTSTTSTSGSSPSSSPATSSSPSSSSDSCRTQIAALSVFAFFILCCLF